MRSENHLRVLHVSAPQLLFRNKLSFYVAPSPRASPSGGTAASPMGLPDPGDTRRRSGAPRKPTSTYVAYAVRAQEAPRHLTLRSLWAAGEDDVGPFGSGATGLSRTVPSRSAIYMGKSTLLQIILSAVLEPRVLSAAPSLRCETRVRHAEAPAPVSTGDPRGWGCLGRGLCGAQAQAHHPECWEAFALQESVLRGLHGPSHGLYHRSVPVEGECAAGFEVSPLPLQPVLRMFSGPGLSASSEWVEVWVIQRVPSLGRGNSLAPLWSLQGGSTLGLFPSFLSGWPFTGVMVREVQCWPCRVLLLESAMWPSACSRLQRTCGALCGCAQCQKRPQSSWSPWQVCEEPSPWARWGKYQGHEEEDILWELSPGLWVGKSLSRSSSPSPCYIRSWAITARPRRAQALPLVYQKKIHSWSSVIPSSAMGFKSSNCICV